MIAIGENTGLSGRELGLAVGRLLWRCKWESGSFKFPRGRKGPLPVSSPLPHPTETMRVVAGSPEGKQWDGMVKLLPARK